MTGARAASSSDGFRTVWSTGPWAPLPLPEIKDPAAYPSSRSKNWGYLLVENTYKQGLVL